MRTTSGNGGFIGPINIVLSAGQVFDMDVARIKGEENPNDASHSGVGRTRQ